jgi:hypothetical protein
MNYKHQCPDWDFLTIDKDSPEFECCLCSIDSNGLGPRFLLGDKVLVLPNNLCATVVKQYLHYDGDESFWGNVLVKYEDNVLGTSNHWQLQLLNES